MKERKKFEIIRKISEILNSHNPKKNVLITVVDLNLPQKGGKMKVYLSIFPEKERKEVIEYFNKISKTIKNELKENVYLRHLPSKIVFYPSDEFIEAQKIFEIIDKIKDEIKEKENTRTEN